jgi:hypothetical protein
MNRDRLPQTVIEGRSPVIGLLLAFPRATVSRVSDPQEASCPALSTAQWPSLTQADRKPQQNWGPLWTRCFRDDRALLDLGV